MDRLTELATEMLDDSYATLWGRAFDLSQPESKAIAARWFAEQVRKLMGAADILHYDGTRWDFYTVIADNSPYQTWIVDPVE